MSVSSFVVIIPQNESDAICVMPVDATTHWLCDMLCIESNKDVVCVASEALAVNFNASRRAIYTCEGPNSRILRFVRNNNLLDMLGSDIIATGPQGCPLEFNVAVAVQEVIQTQYDDVGDEEEDDD